MNQLIQIFLLGKNWFWKTRMLFLYCFLKLKKLFGFGDYFRQLHRVKIQFQGKNFDFYLKSILDFYLLREVFIDEHYAACKQIDPAPKVIFDMGSNIGASVIYFKLIFPEAIVYCFEPNPGCLPSLKANLQQFSQSVFIMDAAIAPESGETLFFANDQHWSASLFHRDCSTESIPVRALSLSDALIETGVSHIDLMKFDVEGAEYGIFESFQSFERVQHFIGEIHPIIVHKTVEDFLTYFPRHKVINLSSAGAHYHLHLAP